MRKYDTDTARRMIEIVYQNQLGGIGCNELQRRVGLVNHNKKFNNLMKGLRERKIFELPNSIQRGRKIHVRLTEEAKKTLFEHGELLLIPDLSPINKKNENKTILAIKSHRITMFERIQLAVVVQAAFGTVTEIRTMKPRRGDIMMEDPLDNSKKMCFTLSFPKPGMAVGDIIDKQIRPGRNARLLDKRRNSLRDELFSHIVVQKRQAKKILESLVDSEPPILIKTKYENEDRFEIADPVLRQYIEWWVLSIFEVRLRMEYCYINGKLDREQLKEFIEWFEKLFGLKSKAWEVYSNLDLKKHYPEKKLTKKELDRLDLNILAYQEILYGNSKDAPNAYAFRNMKAIYSNVVKSMMKFRYPPFLGKRLEQLNKIGNTLLK